MISVIIENRRYNVPTVLNDIDIARHIKIMAAEAKMPDILRKIVAERDNSVKEELQARITKKDYGRLIIPYFASFISAATDIPVFYLIGDERVKGQSLEQIEKLYYGIVNAYTEFEYSEASEVEIEVTPGVFETWELPKNFMEGNTLYEFLAAAEYEAATADLAAGKWEAVLYILAILCRPKGELFNDEIIEERAEFFKGQRLSVALQAAFFLLRQSANFQQDSIIYLAEKVGRAAVPQPTT